MTFTRRFLLQGVCLSVVASAALAAGLGSARADDIDSAELLKPDTLPEIVMGEANAPVTIVEYHSMTCPHCANFHMTVLPTLDEKYIKTGKVRLILRGFPLNQLDAVAFMMLRCRPQDTYLGNVKLFYETQQVWAFSDKPKDAVEALGTKIGYNQETFETCMKDETTWNGLVSVAKKAAETFQVDGTPAFFINGTRQGSIATVAELETKLATFIKN